MHSFRWLICCSTQKHTAWSEFKCITRLTRSSTIIDHPYSWCSAARCYLSWISSRIPCLPPKAYMQWTPSWSSASISVSSPCSLWTSDYLATSCWNLGLPPETLGFPQASPNHLPGPKRSMTWGRMQISLLEILSNCNWSSQYDMSQAKVICPYMHTPWHGHMVTWPDFFPWQPILRLDPLSAIPFSPRRKTSSTSE